MAKTLGKLRAKTLKLREIEPPNDVSKGTKAFVRKHVYVMHPDANENGDDVFKATNIKRSKRSPDHGYEPGEDEDIYEGVMKDFATKMDDMESMPNHPIWDESHPNHESAKRFLKSAPDSPQKRRIVKELGRDLKSGGEMQHHKSEYGITEKTEDLGEMRGLATLMAIRAAARAVRNNRSERSKPKKTKRGELLLTPDMQDPEQKAQLANFDAKIGRLVGHKTDMAAAAKLAAKRKVARDYWGEGLDIKKSSMGTVIKDFQQSDAPQFRGKSAAKRRQMAIAAKMQYEGFEHIAAMSESDQALLVDTYNSLTEENQVRFLEIAETEEGCDKLLDFCVTSRGND